MEKLLNEVKSFLKAVFWFIFACVLVPVLIASFICERYKFQLTNYVLGLKYPTLSISKSKKIRTLVDTPRNAGIFHFLLHVKGKCDLERIKQQYAEHLTEVREKCGVLRFPKLRQQLVTCWGHYAWVKDNSSFNIDNHIVMSPQNFRGRPINESNIQEFVSELVAKYIPSDLPQWQVILIPITPATATNSTEEKTEDEQYYILVKLHHLIIAEEEDLHISEMLMLRDRDNMHFLKVQELNERASKENLSHFVRQPVHIQKLLVQLWKLVVNSWNEFVYKYESLETPDGVAEVRPVNLSQLFSLMLIVLVNVCVTFWKRLQLRKKLEKRAQLSKDTVSGWGTFTNILAEEIQKRQLTWDIATNALLTSMQPANLTKTFTIFMWHATIKKFLMLPYRCYSELTACRELLFKGETRATKTYASRLAIYVPLLIYAQLEFFKICYEIFKAPVNIYEELFQHPSKEPNILQMKSYSGRKIVSFSKSFDAQEIRARNNFSKDVHESDFILACLGGSIYDYFTRFRDAAPIPRILNTTCRTLTKGYFTDRLADKNAHIGGVVFLQIPLRIPHYEHARQIHAIVDDIRSKQIMIYLSSMGQTKYDMLTSLLPSVFTKIFINYFSYNFPVTLTEIHGATSDFELIWGQKVEDVLLFRPPQSKTCLSLNIHRFGDKYRLAVMADTQLGIEHSKITRSFEKYMERATL